MSLWQNWLAHQGAAVSAWHLLECFGLVLSRCDANPRGRAQNEGEFGMTILHSVAGARGHVTAEARAALATMLLDAGARLDVRDRCRALGDAGRVGAEDGA